MVTDNIIVNFVLTQQLQAAFENIRLSPRISKGDYVIMPKGKNLAPATDPFANLEEVVNKIDLAFDLAAKEAKGENDSLGLPTPVGENGKVAYYLRGKKITLDT